MHLFFIAIDKQRSKKNIIQAGSVIVLCLVLFCTIINVEIIDIKKKIENFKQKLITIQDNSEVFIRIELYMDFVEDSLVKLNSELEKNKTLNDYENYLIANGIKIGYSEGDIFLYFDPMFAVINFKNILPDIFLKYFSIKAQNIKEGFEEDGALIITLGFFKKKNNYI